MKSFIKKNYFDISHEDIRDFTKASLKVILGGMILGLAYSKWMLPNEIINGGVTSLSMILSKVSGLSVQYFTQILTIGFLLLSFIFLGGKNFVLSIVSSIAYTFFFSFFLNLDFSLHVNLVVDLLLACVTIGTGYYLCISAGASTVGIEVLALILKTKKKNLDLPKAISYLNFTVLLAGLIVYGIVPVIIGIIFSFLYSKILGVLLNRDKEKAA